MLALWGVVSSLTPPLVPIVAPAEAVAGTARTVQMVVGSSGPGMAPLFELLSSDLGGAALVITGATAVAGAVWGELLATAATSKGAAAVLVHGAVRDRSAMRVIGLPVYAAGERTVGPNGTAHVVAIGEPVSIDGVTVAAGDAIVADAGGCARVPAAWSSVAMDAARRYADAEERVRAALVAGEPLTSAYRYKSEVVAQLRALAR